jgi:hypothetical protein
MPFQDSVSSCFLLDLYDRLHGGVVGISIVSPGAGVLEEGYAHLLTRLRKGLNVFNLRIDFGEV